MRILAVAGAVALAATLAYPRSAAAAGDPVASGSLKLTLSGGFKSQLKSNGVRMSRREFTIKEGTIDPTAGTGSLTLDGKLKFKGPTGKLVFKKVTARLGGRGLLKGPGTKLFKLRGGKVDRNGFGADITGISVKLLRKGAKTLNRKLGLHSLRAGNAGKASISEQPKTVRVKSGQMRVVPSLDPSGSIAFKLFSHCVNPIMSVNAISPAQQDSNLNFIFPVTGGTIGPNGREGLTLTGGGTQINKDPLQTVGVCGGVPNEVNIKQTNLQLDMTTNHGFAEAVIGGYAPPLGGPKGVAIALEIDKSRMFVDAHPKAGKITISGLNLGLSQAAVIFLNLVFPNASGNPQADFKAGDLFGQATLTLTTR